MSRRTSKRSRQGSPPRRRRQIVITIIVVLSLFAAWTMLAYSGALDSAPRQKAKKGKTVSIAGLNSNSPSKEFIYGAGGKLVASEEATSSGCASPPSPGNTLVATAQSTTSVVLNWAASAGADHYEVQRKQNINSAWVTLSPNPATNSFTDNPVVAGTTYLYQVRAVGAAGACPSAFSNVDLATTVIFTQDPPVTIGSTIYAVHLTRLQTAVNAVHMTAGLAPFDWGDSNAPMTVAPTTGGTILKDQVQKLRNTLNQARLTLSLPAQPYTDEPLTRV